VFLSERTVLPYLVKQRFASVDDVVSGRFLVRSLSRRNRDFWVQAADHHYFVKQAGRWTAAARSTIDAEAAWYRHIQLDSKLASVKAIAPTCLAYDPASSALILEYFPRHVSLYESKLRFDSNTANCVGRIVADIHTKTVSPESKEAFADAPPWVFALHHTTEESLENPSGGRRELLRSVRRHRQFGKLLDKIRQTWRYECLIHGDCKLENWLVDDTSAIRLIDWECIVWGDPLWDVATTLQSYWNFHVRWPRLHAPEKMRPALRAFLEGYRERQPFTTAESLNRVIAFAGVRMLQSAFESVEWADALTPRAVRLLQAALNIMTRPEWAARYFLGEDWQISTLN
jgi:Ser/Thr protein kinase RdoA (MazF antagonist)